MKKIIGLLLVISLFSVTAFADMKSANALYNSGNIAGAKAAYINLAITDTTGEALLMQGVCEKDSGNYTAAIALFNSVLAKEGATGGTKSWAEWNIGWVNMLQKNYADAIVAFDTVVTMKEADPGRITIALLHKAWCLRDSGHEAEFQEALLQVCNVGGDISIFSTMPFRIDRKAVGTAKYVQYLKNLLLAVTVTKDELQSIDPVTVTAAIAKKKFIEDTKGYIKQLE